MKKITTNDLRRMNATEGLILQGCGGDLDEWVLGISEMLAKEEILLEGDSFKEVSSFEHEGLTNLLFSLEQVKLDWGRLAMWRINTQENFGSTWLSDYVPNKLGDFIIPDEIHTSPDFQCDQTSGFPTVLVWNQTKGTTALEPSPGFADDSEEARQCLRECTDWGIKPCNSWEDYNDLLESLGEEAHENGCVYIDDEEEFETESRILPDCPLIGQDGNIFNLIGIAARTLKENGMKEEAAEMRQRVLDSGGYDNALGIISEYVNITSVDDEDFDEDEELEMGGMI